MALFFGTAMIGLIGVFLAIRTVPIHTAYTAEVPGTVISSQFGAPRSDYRVAYVYTFAGTTYADDRDVAYNVWNRQFYDPLPRVCLNPAFPAKHILILDPKERCGHNVGSVQTATPQTEAPR